MTESEPTFDTYQAFATKVFESGLHNLRPRGMAEGQWDEHVTTFAVLSFNEEVLMSQLAAPLGISHQAVKARLLTTEQHFSNSLSNRCREAFTPEVIAKSFHSRDKTLGYKRALSRNHGGVLATMMEHMDHGASYTDAIAALPDGTTLTAAQRERLRELKYDAPERMLQKRGMTKEIIQDPYLSALKLSEVFKKMTKSYFDDFSRGEHSPLVSFLKTLQGMGLPVNSRSTRVIGFLEKELFEKGIVVGQLPFMVKQDDGAYLRKGAYHYHRRMDKQKIEEQMGFMLHKLAELKLEHE